MNSTISNEKSDHGSDTSESNKSLQYIDIQWLSAYGINGENALEYFYTSPFFDSRSNNQSLRLQGVENARREGILQSLTGKEYVLDTVNTAEPNLFVVREQLRRSPRPNDVSLMNVFYILDGVIYQSPVLLDLLNSRMKKVAGYMSSSFSMVRDSVQWKFESADRSQGGKETGFHVWSSDDEITSTSNVEDDIQTAKYQKTIREWPSFQNVLLDAHSAHFS